jgi:type II secretory ATPase GspE/PulE/Tfp pilus assembly ATPase PilB-like protein
MHTPLDEQLRQRLPKLDSSHALYVTEVVEAILVAAREAAASDVHLLPTADALRVLWRVDGVLHPVAEFPKKLAVNLLARLKVLADLLTYRTDIPQEGRLRQGTEDVEMRLSTFPTLFGEKGVVRLFVGSGRYRFLDELGLPAEIETELKRLLLETGGTILLTGPAGSGKTTTAYACLRELIRHCGPARSLVSLEDPVEAVVAGVSQSQINPAAGFDYATGLKSLLRQDPEVMLVGEIRDRETAETVFQACLTGHLVLTTFHAGRAAEAVSRLADMGLEPYLLRSGIRAVISQRLVRELCPCAEWTEAEDARLGLDVPRVRVPVGCDLCRGTGYQRRAVLAEMLLPNLKGLGRAILSRGDAAEIEELAIAAGMVPLRARAAQAVPAGTTSPAEMRRVFGFYGSSTGVPPVIRT